MIKDEKFSAALDEWSKENVSERYLKQFKDIATRSFNSAAGSEQQMAARRGVIESSCDPASMSEYMAAFHRHVLRVMRKPV